MKPMFEDLQNTKNSFYALLRVPETPDSVVAKAAAAIGDKQRAIDMQVFQHFKNSRQVCTPAQYAKYDSLVQVVIRRMSGPSFNNNNKGKREEPGRK
jgi:periplasmic protein CpxP/Spy